MEPIEIFVSLILSLFEHKTFEHESNNLTPIRFIEPGITKSTKLHDICNKQQDIPWTCTVVHKYEPVQAFHIPFAWTEKEYLYLGSYRICA